MKKVLLVATILATLLTNDLNSTVNGGESNAVNAAGVAPVSTSTPVVNNSNAAVAAPVADAVAAASVSNNTTPSTTNAVPAASVDGTKTHSTPVSGEKVVNPNAIEYANQGFISEMRKKLNAVMCGPDHLCIRRAAIHSGKTLFYG